MSRLGDTIYANLTAIIAVSSIVFIVAAAAVLLENAYASIVSNGLGFLTSTNWNPSLSGSVQTINGIQRLSGSSFGVLVFVVDTLVSSTIAVTLAVPAGLGVAFFLTEVAPQRISAPVSFMVEMLAGIPSVVYGFWGFLVLGPYLYNYVEPYLSRNLSFIPLFSGPLSSPGLLSAGIILAIMIVPIIASISRDMMARTPKESRDGAKALGLTRWEVARRVVLPYAKTGIVGSIILGLGRALGETMAVAMIMGSGGLDVPKSLYYPFSTIASYMVLNLGGALFDPSHMFLSAIVELGLILLGITIVVNIVARLLIKQGFASSSETMVRV